MVPVGATPSAIPSCSAGVGEKATRLARSLLLLRLMESAAAGKSERIAQYNALRNPSSDGQAKRRQAALERQRQVRDFCQFPGDRVSSELEFCSNASRHSASRGKDWMLLSKTST